MKIRLAPSCTGFSLLELLTVIAVISLLAALVMPAVSGVSRAYNLTAGTEAFLSQINLARQEAISRNRVVRFELVKAPRDGSTNAYRAMRLIVLDEAAQPGSNAITNKVTWLPQGVVVSEDASRSSFGSVAAPTNVALPGNVSGTSTFFAFRPNGMVDLPTAFVHWTLVDERAGTNNFSTLQLDTRTGRPRLFRP